MPLVSDAVVSDAVAELSRGMPVARPLPMAKKAVSKRAAKRTLILTGGKKKAGRRSPPAHSEKVPYRN
jgi:hypothetical protein